MVYPIELNLQMRSNTEMYVKRIIFWTCHGCLKPAHKSVFYSCSGLWPKNQCQGQHLPLFSMNTSYQTQVGLVLAWHAPRDPWRPSLLGKELPTVVFVYFSILYPRQILQEIQVFHKTHELDACDYEQVQWINRRFRENYDNWLMTWF